MKISIKKSDKAGAMAVAFIFKSKGSVPKSLSLYEDSIQPLLKDGIFKAESRTSFFLPLPNKKYLLLVGLGEEKDFDYEGIRQAGAKAYKGLKAHSQITADILVESLITAQTKDWERAGQALTEGLILTSYKCDKFKKKPKKEKRELKECFLCLPKKEALPMLEKGLKRGTILGRATNCAKELANTPGNLMTPSILARSVQKQVQNTKIKLSIWNRERIKKEKMGGLLGVSLGSPEEPRFIIMEYKGAGEAQPPVIFVGKGLTFDSGGISLKPSLSMDEMKFDMCGASAVIGALLAIEKLSLKVNVMGLVPSSENMPGGNANKPGDILTARNGKSMEVLNTDAEGRLILADALSYASEQKPLAIFDTATLTGAIIVSLGNIFTGFFTKNEKLVKKIHQAGQKSGERLWQLPLTKEHAKDMKSHFADVANISSHKGASSSTAAAFLEHFVDKDIPWAHFDIAGTAWNVHNRLEYCSNKMAGGVMVRTFVELAQSYEK